MTLDIIVAMTKDRVIGVNNRLPWNIPEDLQHFRRTTEGNAIIMGRGTYESIGKPLLKRTNIVLSKTMEQCEGLYICTSLEEAITIGKEYNEKTYIIGGASVYEKALPLVDSLIISMVYGEYQGDTYFPEIDLSEWYVSSRKSYAEFSVQHLQRH
jgi:dihydrofolate reductase